MTGYDWSRFPVVVDAGAEEVPEMVRRALGVLEDLLLATNHGCTFTLADGPLVDGDVATSVTALLPAGCRVDVLSLAEAWTPLVRSALPARFIPSELASHDVPMGVVRALADWTEALLGLIWPESAPSWTVEVECPGWYEGSYLDVAVLAGDRMWLLHLGVSD
ncbi:hypothetical protein J2S43_001444 [Catenuloplanes nepalensis]|uniref:Uncharacterized protein n=1 Tax=Catenuloplanes nepalensis TaxID=587533 RepID=A0ABT9MNF1_9ACTN|nr:hypothetical protein [Catenuloplanes nepalensis]MDP9792932.1 hypothetical protein [Catenuloplanes nepalensis]